ncbi:hypothetical protein CF77_gp40 [Oenococcus phage phi9805]|uniref:Uncharacterized protein n=1 Tax=Oenococcus phage phi9805 TaxID=1435411 RepID=V9QKG0_9CAUD|nr:hypothetical protein CF77_gp40 [Oenococcus phage phi9805]AHC30325.1 hypothetical protein [Oenococcus phage phi9805]
MNIVKYVSSNLRINLPIYSEKRGRCSIQINDLPRELNNSVFKSRTCFLRNYPGVQHQKKRLINFKIFTLMDLDDVNDQSIVNNYKDGHISNLGSDHWIKPYLCPIFCDRNLEDVLKKLIGDMHIEIKTKKIILKFFLYSMIRLLMTMTI